MEPRNLARSNSSGNEGHGVHMCRKCGWPFPNPHPSAKHRRAHKRVCGAIEGYKRGDHGESMNHLDASDDDSKTPSIGLKKTVERSISRGSSGVGSRSSRSTRSNEDVFSDAVTDFEDFPASTDSVDVIGEPGNVIQDVSKDGGVPRLSIEKTIADAGDLYPPDKAELEAVESYNLERERVDVDMPSQHHLSGTNLDSVLISLMDSEEKGRTEGALEEKSEDVSVHTEEAGKTSEAVFLPQTVEGGGLESVLADAVTEVVIARQGDGFHDKNERSPDFDFVAPINSLEKGRMEVAVDKESEDILGIPSEDAVKTSKEVEEGSLEMIEKQGNGFGAKDDFSPEGVNVEPGSSDEVDEGNGCRNDNDGLPLREQSEVILEDRVTENLLVSITPNDAQEGKSVEHSKVCVTKDALSSLSSLVGPSKGFNSNSEDIVAEDIIHHEYNSVEVSRENKLESADADTTGHGSVVASLDNERDDAGHGGMFTSTEEKNPPVSVDTNFHVSEPIQNGSENGSELSVPTETLSVSNSYITSEKNSLQGIDRGNYEVRSREVEEKLSEFTIVRQTDAQMDGELGEERNDARVCEEASALGPRRAILLEGEFQMSRLRDPEEALKESGSSVEQPVDGECANSASESAILSVVDSLGMIEQKYHDENCVRKASDSCTVGVTGNDARLNNIEVSEGPKELQSFGERVSGEECINNVDFSLISDNDDSIAFTKSKANGSSSREHRGAVSAAEDHSSNDTNGRASGFADLDRNLVKQEEAIDTRADSSSQSDSLECNWGSVSDAPATTDFKSQPSQASVKMEEASLQPKSDNRKSVIFAPTVEYKTVASNQNEGVSEVHISQKPEQQAGWFSSQTSGANEPPGRKRDKEIIEKVTNWSTVRQHMPLKSYLRESSPNAKDNPSFMSQKMKRATTRDSKETVDEAMMGEWNSPARYPANIKREKSKARSKAWVPFICCSSVQTS